MNTVDDFVNASDGTIAVSPSGNLRFIKETQDDDSVYRDLTWRGIGDNHEWASSDSLARSDFRLLVVPQSAREALDLAWDLAHPVKEGQLIPAGTDFLVSRNGERPATMRASLGLFASKADETNLRTLDPLPELEPDWLDAPAVLAMDRWDDLGREKVWIQMGGDSYKGEDGEFRAWSDLRDVTPLYPKETLAEAWDEGHEAAAMRVPEGVWHDTASPRTPNPYRKEQDR